MATATESSSSTARSSPAMLKRVIFSMGGKGGVGKSTVMAGITEYLKSLRISTELLDLDWENKKEGSLTGWFSDAIKVDIRKSNAYDVLIDRAFRTQTDVVLADLGASQGYRLFDWFEDVYKGALKLNVPLRFTAVGIVTADPASQTSILEWAAHMQDRVDYLIVKNKHRIDDVVAWKPESNRTIATFQATLSPVEIEVEARDSEIESKLREAGRTLTSVVDAGMNMGDAELGNPATYIRVFGYRDQLFSQLSKADRILLP
jgi:hypothetical protein